MKKTLLIASILMAFAACSTVEQKSEITEQKNIYFKQKKAYSIVNDNPFTGVTKKSSSYGDSIEVMKFVDGNISNFKEIEDNELTQSVSFDKDGKIKGNFYYKDYNEIYEGTIEDSLFSGTVKITDYYDEDSEDFYTYKNGLLHGKTIEEGVEYFYNQGMTVKDMSQVEEAKAFDIPKDSISADKALFDENRKITVEGQENFNGYLSEEGYDMMTYYKVVNNIITEERVFSAAPFEISYPLEFNMYTPQAITIYNEDGSSNTTTYSSYSNPGKFNSYTEYDAEGQIDGKVITIDYYGQKTVKTQHGNTLVGDTYIYNPDGSIAEIHSYNDKGYTLVAYYDKDNNKIRVEGQGLKVDDAYYRTGNWKWYYDNGQMEYEADFYLDEDYSYVKSFYKDGTLESEGKMDYCACTYIGEYKEYNQDGTIKNVYQYDENGELINNQE